jgi:type IV pilus biogenesis protein CpaD/CtpE
MMRALAIAVIPTFLLASVLALTGCGSAPKMQAQKPQYCHTNQIIKTQNGERVESMTVVECTDDQFKRLTAVRMGMAGQCGIANRTVQSGDKLVNVQIKSCQILDHNGAVVGYEYVH